MNRAKEAIVSSEDSPHVGSWRLGVWNWADIPGVLPTWETFGKAKLILR